MPAWNFIGRERLAGKRYFNLQPRRSIHLRPVRGGRYGDVGVRRTGSSFDLDERGILSASFMSLEVCGTSKTKRMGRMSEAMEPIQPVASKMITAMAGKYFPDGSILKCVPCGKQRHCTTSEIAEYMTHGFPSCRACGHKVDLVTPRDERTARR